MEIESKTTAYIRETGVQNSAATQKPAEQQMDSKAPAQANSVSKEQLSLTPVSQSLLSVLEGSEQKDIDLAKVEALRSAISEGRYQVDAESIAESLIKTEKELL